MNIRWSDEAMRDLHDLHAYVSLENPLAAQKLVLKIVTAVETQLPDNPHIGRPGRVSGTRELIISNTSYVVPYRVRDRELQILRVYHAARRWPDRL